MRDRKEITTLAKLLTPKGVLLGWKTRENKAKCGGTKLCTRLRFFQHSLFLPFP